MPSFCRSGSLENPSSGRCKTCKSFTVAELVKMCKKYGLSTRGDKEELCTRLLRHFMKGGKRKTKSNTRRRKTKSSTRKRKTKSRTGRRKTKSSTRKRKTQTRRRPKSRSRSKTRRRTTTRRRSQPYKWQRAAARRGPSVTYGRGYVRVSPSRSYPSAGTGSYQKRHFSSKRKGPSLPAQSHCGETARGNDGNMWESRRDRSGACRWRKL